MIAESYKVDLRKEVTVYEERRKKFRGTVRKWV